jgi:biotin-dependent carboxylase-like uncharacterized protein
VITVLRAPPFATVQDLGRRGHLDAAVPPAGALDQLGLAAGNLLVGNAPGAAALEWALGGGELRLERGATVALTGASATCTLGGRQLDPATAARAERGDSLVVERIDHGAWLYIAVSGGIDLPAVLGSRSTYVPARFGGLEGRLLRSGDRLPLGSETGRPAVGPVAPGLTVDSTRPIRILPGCDLLPTGGWDQVLDSEYVVSRTVSRMGYRLEGGPRSVSITGDRPSAPACVGTLQLPAGGQPIVLLADGPTVGGYARIGVIVTADLGSFAQRRPGEPVRFRSVDLGEARQALRERMALLDRLERGA